MKYQYKPSFEKTIKKLELIKKEKVKKAIHALVLFFETGKRTEGMGLKKLKRDFWEIRANIHDRILFRLRNDVVEFIISGNHDEIKRYLKNVSG
jgi:mRNA-degrading endonuclease YafQ of YafQ-DinJ toxin-antitoxin module